MSNKILENLTGVYPISKTLRFELKPIGNTKKFIYEKGVVITDTQLNEDYKYIKKRIDEYHKYFIEKSLSTIHFDNLNEYYNYINNKEKKKGPDFEKLKTELRKKVVESFKNQKEDFVTLFSKELLNKKLAPFLMQHSDFTQKDHDTIERLKGFTTYFSGFNENRRNMYSSEANITSISNRVIEENLPIYVNNMKSFDVIKKEIDFTSLNEEINKKYKDSRNINDYFELEGFNYTLTQKDIDKYNYILGGFETEENVKIKGINEYVNEYNQKISKNDNKKKLSKLTRLRKQILSDRTHMSFLLETIDNDAEAIDAIKDFYELYNSMIFEKENNKLIKMFKNIEEYDLDRIYINSKYIKELSNTLTGDWNIINMAMSKYYDNNYTGNSKVESKKYIDEKEKFLKLDEISLKYINDSLKEYDYEGSKSAIDYITNNLFNDYLIFNNINDKYNEFINKMDKCEKRGEFVSIVKNLLDEIKKFESIIRMFIIENNEIEKDGNFYSELIEIYYLLKGFDKIYGMVRNYLTKKPYNTDKIKVNFECPTFLNGWDISKETANLGTILRKDGKYYLGIISNYKKVFEKYRNNQEKYINETDYYEKVEYKLLPGPNKMLPKVFLSEKGIENYKPSLDLLKKYKEECHKKGEKFDINFMRELINFFKVSIEKNPDWNCFDFKFSDTNSYENISDFYKEVENQGYKINFIKIPSKDIDDLVEEGKMYLFQIYNKDFSEYSKGNPNLHTMFWKGLFDEENLKNIVFKLNGQAEMFYRKASISEKNRVIHEKGVKINRNGLKAKEDKLTSLFEYDIIKDRRYTEDKFHFHTPITINFKAHSNINVNNVVNQNIKESEEIYVLGIDRGERHLLYLSLIDSNGNIVKQETLNIIKNDIDENNEVNYHKLLNEKEIERKQAKVKWQNVQNIKELKSGYLSQVVNKIAEYIFDKKCLIVMEDLNSGFKNSRIKIDKQVYQRFENALISKLNYLTKKNIEKGKEGSISKGYQLTRKVERLTNKFRQNGIVFYVPAWNTSKIDPMTGFVDLIYPKYINIIESKKFIDDFDNIRYNIKEEYFEFDVDYSKIAKKDYGIRSKWTICTYSDRIVVYRNKEKNNEYDYKTVDLTEEFKKLFSKYNIDINNIKETSLKIEDAEFYKEFIHLFKLTLQMRNSDKEVDYLISPVKNNNGTFFDTRNQYEKLPLDADANGAYNIAMKGLMYVDIIKSSDKPSDIKFNITNKDWLSYVQKRSDN